jgi:hypothetical protein
VNYGLVIAVDPGASGAVVVRSTAGAGAVRDVLTYESRRTVDAVIRRWCGDSASPDAVALIEKVGASGLMMPANAFSFGGNYEGWIHAFIGAQVPCFTVTPQRWQRAVVPHVTSMGDVRKRDLRDAAKALFDLPVSESLLPPKTRITLDNCDALLLSEYALRQLRKGEPLGEPTL